MDIEQVFLGLLPTNLWEQFGRFTHLKTYFLLSPSEDISALRNHERKCRRRLFAFRYC